MSQNTPPKPAQLPPALRPKPLPKRPKGEISDGFAPITPRPRPVVSTPPTPLETGEPTLPASAPSPTPAPAPVRPSSSAPALTPTKRPPYSPKPTPVNGRVPKLEGRVTLFEGTFRAEGQPPFVVETPLTGMAANDRQSLINLARKKYPKGAMQLKSTRIFTREEGAKSTFLPGTTMGQLFGEAGSLTEVQVEIGHVFFQGVRCQVVLRNLRSRSCVTLSLRPPTGGTIIFSNQIEANRLAKELPLIVKEILGNGARELTITLIEA